RDRAVDDTRIASRDRRIVEAQPLHHAWTEAFDKDVSPVDQVPEPRLPVLALEVEHDALLPAIEVSEPYGLIGLERLLPACRIAGRRLDLQDLCALVRHHQRHHWSRKEDRKVEDANAAQLAHVRATPSRRNSARSSAVQPVSTSSLRHSGPISA